MEHKLKSVLSGTGFYLLLGVCLIAAAVSGWYLLFAGDKPVVEEAPPTEAVSALALAGEDKGGDAASLEAGVDRSPSRRRTRTWRKPPPRWKSRLSPPCRRCRWTTRR